MNQQHQQAQSDSAPGPCCGESARQAEPELGRREERPAQRLRGEGKTAMFLAVDGKPAGLVAVADPIKATTPQAIRALHEEGCGS